MKTYIGSKIIRAEEMSKNEFLRTEKRPEEFTELEVDEPGYRIFYPDNYVSWSPKAVFETAYREVSGSEIDLINAEG
ncbi:hypothetical protein [Leptospira stimsonii]|uniref:Uncharacterized protein n=1 Tax=Leptospira stimsonii TaxID=2202203 RepID=A0ABY2N8Y5_9LEPT|nr:hypothetical protein [Leptospira stimsonii]TGK12843.1 hypothetical protein EHO98_19585 [Leptospira stimsonii]TGM18781.1 hypothetical protein EHQ90_06460 [Leptospira stimsonii]